MHGPKSRSKRKNRGRPGSLAGTPFEALEGLLGGSGEFATRAGEKMSKQGSFAGQDTVFAHTSPFRPPQHFFRGVVIPLKNPLQIPQSLVVAACTGIRIINERGNHIQKAWIILLALAAPLTHQAELDLGGNETGEGASPRCAISSSAGFGFEAHRSAVADMHLHRAPRGAQRI